MWMPSFSVDGSTNSRDDGQDTQGVDQISYEVTFVRPIGAVSLGLDRQIRDKARSQFHIESDPALKGP
jgi:hypothetical protein